ncbi:MAG: DUF4269 domain-containing protein [Tunicatimonas sp.]|uniref:DUF4269 domain-containing protein n=1 Tax=Tunicatimonas sp. TaxID=1940096 RepID=UPI003C706A19
MEFNSLSYLKEGTAQQQSAYRALHSLDLFNYLSEYYPLLTGTVPLRIDIDSSDLDICCEVHTPKLFVDQVTKEYGDLPSFQVLRMLSHNLLAILIRFRYQSWPIELFGQPLPATKQHAYRHMIVEHRILQLASVAFREQIKELKQQGIKTEPAFAQLLNLQGDPYQAVLNLENYSDDQLWQLLSSKGYTGK